MINNEIRLRVLERDDLRYLHQLRNDPTMMMHWFQEPYFAIEELHTRYDEWLVDDSARRFLIENEGDKIGYTELVNIDYIHRKTEFSIMVDPAHQGQGFASIATTLTLNYAFTVLNMNKVYLYVDTTLPKAIHIYQKAGFQIEGNLRREFFVAGAYHDVLRMGLLQETYFQSNSSPDIPS